MTNHFTEIAEIFPEATADQLTRLHYVLDGIFAPVLFSKED